MRDRPRELVWLGDTLDVLRRFPVGVRQRLGFALYEAQVGLKQESAKPLQGFDTLVWQVRADYPSGTYRAVYLVQFQDAVYVLHAFQKKSKSGISTSQRDIETIRQRLRIARRKVAPGRIIAVSSHNCTVSSGNVFADLGLARSEELLAKAELASRIIAEVERRGLTQGRAAALLGIDQPKVSALKQGKLSAFSIERLLRLVLLLGNDVYITMRQKPKSRPNARLRVA